MCPPAPRSSTLTVGSAGFAPCIGAAIAPPASATAAKAARSLRLLFIVVFLSVGASPFLRLHPVRNTHPTFLTTQFRHLVLVDSTVCFMAIVAPPDGSRGSRSAPGSRRLSHIRQGAEFSLPCLGVYHWLRTQVTLTPATFRLPHPRPSARRSSTLRHNSRGITFIVLLASRLAHTRNGALPLPSQ